MMIKTGTTETAHSRTLTKQSKDRRKTAACIGHFGRKVGGHDRSVVFGH